MSKQYYVLPRYVNNQMLYLVRNRVTNADLVVTPDESFAVEMMTLMNNRADDLRIVRMNPE